MNFKAQVEATIRFFAFVSLFVLVFSLNAVAQEGQDSESSGQDEQKESLSAVKEGSYTLQKMLVTATKRVQLAQDVPFSLNVQSEDDIKRLNTTDLEDLSRNVAGLSIQNLGPGQSVVTIRGVSSGQVVRDQPGVKEQVGVYLDETPISLSLFTPDIDLFDLKRVETLRGPQGTLFGSGSIGGTVRYITNQPLLGVNEVKVEIDGNYMDEGSTGGHIKTALNVPLGEDAAVRLVAYGTRYGGFIDAHKEGGTVDEDVNDGNRYGGRISLLWEPAENLSITPRVIYQNIDLGGFNRQEVFNLFANPYTDPAIRTPVTLGEREQFLLLDEAFEDKTLIFDTVVNWSIEDFFDVTYSASYINRDILVSRDASALSSSVSISPFGGYPAKFIDLFTFPEDEVFRPSNLRDTTNLKQMTHELRVSSSDDSTLQWLAGVFYSNVERNYSQRLPTPGYDAFAPEHILAGVGLTPSDISNGFTDVDSPYISDLTYDLRQIALFGEATYALLERLDLTAGLRWYDWEEDKTFRSGGVFSNWEIQNQEVTVSSDGFTPRFMMSYDATDNFKLNAQISRGFRLGGVNDPLNQELCEDDGVDYYPIYSVYQEFEDETLWNYEVGFKSSFESVTLNGSVFYTDIKNLGVNVDAGPCSSRVSISVPESHTVGAELELTLQPTRYLLVAFAGSYVEAEVDSTLRTVDGGILNGIEKGNRIPSVPDWQLSGSATYTLPGLLSARESYISGSWQFVGDSITQSGDQVPEAGVFEHNLPYAGIPADQTTEVDLLLDSYHLFNLSAGLVYNNLEFTAYVKNLTDENVELSFDRERGGRARLAYRVGQPRTFGLVTRMRF